ncbi:MAG TPA: hypothetical protein DEA08_05890, partial [Planctomycetes bacterium]|nr:hypothetical protein [Planctomycetota bacterium]
LFRRLEGAEPLQGVSRPSGVYGAPGDMATPSSIIRAAEHGHPPTRALRAVEAERQRFAPPPPPP